MTRWQKVKLGDYITQIRGVSYAPSDVSSDECEGYLPILRANNIYENSLVMSDLVYIKRNKISDIQCLKRGDIVVCASSGSKSLVGKAAQVKENYQCSFGAFCKVVRPGEKISAAYLGAYFCSPTYRRIISHLSAGANINNIKSEHIDNLQIPLPPKEEQERIAKELDAVSDLLSKQKQLLTEQDTLIKSVFYDMFGDPVTNDKGWKIEKLEKFVDVIGGYAFKSGLFKKTGIPVLRIGNINTGVLKVDNLTFWDNDKSLSKYVVYPKDLVISLTGTVGKDDYANVCILSGEYNKYYLNQRNAHIVIKTSIDTVYLFCLLRNKEVKSRLTGISRGVRQANISNKDILNLLIPVPPLPLQQKFAAVVEQIEVQKQKIKSAITETETLFNALMAKYFDED